MKYVTPHFTKDMMKDYTILMPDMAPVQFSCLKSAMESEGFHIEMLSGGSSQAAQLGLKYVHNDTCYPALLIIGEFIEALNSGRYDTHHTALLISQSGGGCRASNYIKLLRKALVKAGYEYVPVASANASGLEKDSSIPISFRMMRKALAALEYGDEIASLRNQIVPYENIKGSADEWCSRWVSNVSKWMHSSRNYSFSAMKKKFKEIAEDAARIPVTRVPKVKVGVVGEIFVKFSPAANNHLQAFLEAQDCEVNMPGIMGFVNYCIANMKLDQINYDMNWLMGNGAAVLLKALDSLGTAQSETIRKAGFYAQVSFKELMTKTEGILSLGVKMGEGWLLSAEMVELIESGYDNIVCAQPFGCLPNHIAGKGVTNKIRSLFANANITAVDYDPSANQVNQENRIKLMLAVAKEKLDQ